MNKQFNNKVAMYCRISREIEDKSNDEINKMTKELNEKFKNILDYKPYKGFYDLRNYKLNEKEFKDFWITQDFLNYCELNKEMIKNNIPELYEELKELSANYQQDLLTHEELEEEIEK